MDFKKLVKILDLWKLMKLLKYDFKFFRHIVQVDEHLRLEPLFMQFKRLFEADTYLWIKDNSSHQLLVAELDNM